MAEKMTLKMVRDEMRMIQGNVRVTCTKENVGEWADAIDAHLAQPAQAVDALQDAIFQIAERLGEVRDPGMDDMSWHTQLIARAQYLANAQAVDVGAIREVIKELKAGARDSCYRTQQDAEREWRDQLTRAIGNAQADAVKYRLLGPGDVIEPDDEFIDDNAVDWVRTGSAGAGHLFVGMNYRPGVFKQCRRPLPPNPPGHPQCP